MLIAKSFEKARLEAISNQIVICYKVTGWRKSLRGSQVLNKKFRSEKFFRTRKKAEDYGNQFFHYWKIEVSKCKAFELTA